MWKAIIIAASWQVFFLFELIVQAWIIDLREAFELVKFVKGG